jgi:arsenate reductase
MRVATVASLWLGGSVVAGAQSSPAQEPDSQTVVFVCEHGTAKSVLALAWFNRLAQQRGLPVRAVSRGTAPDASLPAFMLAGLKRDGFDLGAFSPARFSEADLRSALAVIAFDQPAVAGFVAGRAPVIAWDRLPSVTASYAAARDSIKERVVALVDSLTARTGPGTPRTTVRPSRDPSRR